MNTDKHLKRIDIENFRSFDRLTVEDFGQVNVIIGRNNSGKTAFMEAIILALMSATSEELIFNLNKIREITARNIDSAKLLFHKLNFSNSPLITASFNSGERWHIKIEAKSNAVIQVSNSSGKEADRLSQTGFFLNQSTINVIDITTQIREEPIIRISLSFNSADDILAFRSGQYKNDRSVIYVPPTTIDPTIKEYLKRLIINKRTSELTAILQQLDNRIAGISLIDSEIYFDLNGLDEFLPINLMGDGIGKVLACITALMMADSSTAVFIDEIENGLHYSSHTALWTSLLDTIRRSGAQLFVTTHNIETLRYLEKALAERADMQPTLSVFDLVRTKRAGFQAYRYTYESLSNALELGNEIRL